MDSNLLTIIKCATIEYIERDMNKITCPNGLARECKIDENANDICQIVRELAAKYKAKELKNGGY